MLRLPHEGACAAAWNWGVVRAPVRRSAFESSAWCLLGACMGASPPDAVLEQLGRLTRRVAHSLHACACARALWLNVLITRHRSELLNNRITELPAQIFDKNINLWQLCVDSHRLAGHVRGGAPATPMLRAQCEGACAAAWNWGVMRAPVRRSAFESSAGCLLGACM